MQKGMPKVYFFDLFAHMGRAGVDCVGVRRRFKRDGAQRAHTRRKTRLLYLDEERDPGEGEGGWEPSPPNKGRGIETRQDL